MKRFIVVFYDDRISPRKREAFKREEVGIGLKWLDDPLGYVAHTRPQEHIHVVLCIPKAGLKALLETVAKRKK